MISAKGEEGTHLGCWPDGGVDLFFVFFRALERRRDTAVTAVPVQGAFWCFVWAAGVGHPRWIQHLRPGLAETFYQKIPTAKCPHEDVFVKGLLDVDTFFSFGLFRRNFPDIHRSELTWSLWRTGWLPGIARRSFPVFVCSPGTQPLSLTSHSAILCLFFFSEWCHSSRQVEDEYPGFSWYMYCIVHIYRYVCVYIYIHTNTYTYWRHTYKVSYVMNFMSMSCRSFFLVSHGMEPCSKVGPAGALWGEFLGGLKTGWP